MAKNTHMDNARLVTLIKVAWNKLNEYYTESDLSKIYLISDRIKLRFFEKTRKKKWMIGAREKLDDALSKFILVTGISKNEGDFWMMILTCQNLMIGKLGSVLHLISQLTFIHHHKYALVLAANVAWGTIASTDICKSYSCNEKVATSIIRLFSDH